MAMRRKLLALLVALALVLTVAVAAGEETDEAQALLEQAYASQELSEAVSLARQAAECAQDGDLSLVFDAFCLMAYADAEGQYADALFSVLQMLLDGAQDAQSMAFLQCVEVMAEAGRSLEMVPLAREMYAQAPEDATLTAALAEALYYGGESDEALSMLEGAQDLQLCMLRGAFFVGLCRYDEAIGVYQEAAQAWPENLGPVYGLYTAYLCGGEFESAVRTIDKLLFGGAGDDMWLERADIRYRRLYQPSQALDEVDALLRYDPDWTQARLLRMDVLIMLERYDDALAEVERASEGDAEREALFRAIIAVNQSDWETARQSLSQIGEESPYYALARLYEACVCMQGYGELEAAYDALAQGFAAGALTSSFGEAMRYLGEYSMQTGQLEQAARAFAAYALAYELEEPDGLYLLGVACYTAGRLDDVVAAVEELERQYPGYYETLSLSMTLHATVGEDEQALACCEEICEKFPFLAGDFAMDRAVLTAAVGDAQQALAMAQDALETAQGNLQAMAAYAYLLASTGDAAGAQEALSGCEALLEGVTGLAAQNGRIALEKVRAKICLLAGDTAGCFTALEAAKVAGWNAREILLWEESAQISDLPEFARLLEGADGEGAWNVQLMPELPAVEE